MKPKIERLKIDADFFRFMDELIGEVYQPDDEQYEADARVGEDWFASIPCPDHKPILKIVKTDEVPE